MAIMKQQVYEHLHQGMGEAESEAAKLMVESFDALTLQRVFNRSSKAAALFSRIGDN